MTLSSGQPSTAPLPTQGDGEVRLIVDNMPGLAWSARPDGTLEYVNSRFLEFVGSSVEGRVEGTRRANFAWGDVLDAADITLFASAWEEAVATGQPFKADFRLARFDGAFRWFRLSASPLRDQDGDVIRWYGVSIDIDDRKCSEEALQKSEQGLLHFLDALPAIVWRATPDGLPNYMNQRAADFSGRSKTDLPTLEPPEGFVHSSDLDRVVREWARAVENEIPFDVSSRHRAADGSYRWFQSRAEPLRDETGRIIHWYGVDVDIDDRIRAEDALRSTQAELSRASELATVSQIAASVAHEISQPLAALVANGHAAQRWLSSDPPNLERALITADRIVRDGSAAVDVVRRIRALFNGAGSKRMVLDLNEVIREVGRLMVDELVSRNASIDMDLDDELPRTLGDRVQMQQVIVNLVRNGAEAMESDDSQEKTVSIRSRRDGSERVLIEISDQGNGLVDIERAFEPFVTTKGQGMGMGLAICRRIVETHDGRLWAARNSPRGTTFSFTLPIAGAFR